MLSLYLANASSPVLFPSLVNHLLSDSKLDFDLKVVAEKLVCAGKLVSMGVSPSHQINASRTRPTLSSGKDRESRKGKRDTTSSRFTMILIPGLVQVVYET